MSATRNLLAMREQGAVHNSFFNPCLIADDDGVDGLVAPAVDGHPCAALKMCGQTGMRRSRASFEFLNPNASACIAADVPGALAMHESV